MKILKIKQTNSDCHDYMNGPRKVILYHISTRTGLLELVEDYIIEVRNFPYLSWENTVLDSLLQIKNDIFKSL